MKPPINNIFCVKTFKGLKSSFVPDGIPIGFEMAEKKLHEQTGRQTNIHFRNYISRDKFQ